MKRIACTIILAFATISLAHGNIKGLIPYLANLQEAALARGFPGLFPQLFNKKSAGKIGKMHQIEQERLLNTTLANINNPRAVEYIQELMSAGKKASATTVRELRKSMAQKNFWRDEITPIEEKKRDIFKIASRDINAGSFNMDFTKGWVLADSPDGIDFVLKQVEGIEAAKVVVSVAGDKILLVPTARVPLDKATVLQWLVGHPYQPYSGRKVTVLKEAQEEAILEIGESIDKKSVLVFGPPALGKTELILRTWAMRQEREGSKKFSLITTPSLELVNQLAHDFSEIGVRVINWNTYRESGEDFFATIEDAIGRDESTVMAITFDSLRLKIREPQSLISHRPLINNLDAIYVDEAHHLGAPENGPAILSLHQVSDSSLFGFTAIDTHHRVDFESFFEAVHRTHGVEQSPGAMVKQIKAAIDAGEITPFNDIYTIDREAFRAIGPEVSGQPVFVKEENGFFYVLNPAYYPALSKIMAPIIYSNPRGFVATSSIAQSEEVTKFLRDSFPDTTFEVYHSKLPPWRKKEVVANAKNMDRHYTISVQGLDEGFNVPDWSAYIDLNASISPRRMLQRVGRVLRLYPGKVKTDILMLINPGDSRDLSDYFELVRASHGKETDSTSKGKRRVITQTGSPLEYPSAKTLSMDELVELSDEVKFRVKGFFVPAEDVSLASLLSHGRLTPEGRDYLFEVNMHLVYNIARSYKNSGLSMEDLIQEGNIGLLNAIDTFDPNRGPFVYYANLKIYHYIQRAVDNGNHQSIRIPPNVRKLLEDMADAENKLTRELGQEATPEEIAAEMDLSPSRVRELRLISTINDTSSMETLPFQNLSATSVGEEDIEPPLWIGEVIPNPSAESFKDELIKRQFIKNFSDKFLTTLTPREALVLQLYYGLSGEEPLSLKEIGQRFDVSAERVRGIKNQAIQKFFGKRQYGIRLRAGIAFSGFIE